MDIFIVGDGTSGTMSANIIYVYNEGINNSNIGQNYFMKEDLMLYLEIPLCLRILLI